MVTLARRALGASGLEVSELALGSWRTYERIPRETGLAVMRKARELGITFLDDARYNDETGTAPLKTGYSEVVFGELFRASGWKRRGSRARRDGRGSYCKSGQDRINHMSAIPRLGAA